MAHNGSPDSVSRSLCAGKNCNFYGDAVTGLCSKCYRDKIQLEQHNAAGKLSEKTSTAISSPMPIPGAVAASEPIFEPVPTESKPKQLEGKCFTCNKKVGLLGFKCRCEYTFCSTHRYCDAHSCTFDYKTAGRELLTKNNPVIMNAKIQKT